MPTRARRDLGWRQSPAVTPRLRTSGGRPVGGVDPEPAPGFGELLRRHRRDAGLSQEGFAEVAGLSVDAIAALEQGHRRAPRPHMLRLLGDALRLSEPDRAQLTAIASRDESGTEPPSTPVAVSSKVPTRLRPDGSPRPAVTAARATALSRSRTSSLPAFVPNASSADPLIRAVNEEYPTASERVRPSSPLQPILATSPGTVRTRSCED